MRKFKYGLGLAMMLVAASGSMAVAYLSTVTLATELDRLLSKGKA